MAVKPQEKLQRNDLHFVDCCGLKEICFEPSSYFPATHHGETTCNHSEQFLLDYFADLKNRFNIRIIWDVAHNVAGNWPKSLLKILDRIKDQITNA